MRLFEVGGSVRDRLLYRPVSDRDFAVEAESFDAMKAWVLEQGGRIFLETPQHLTIRAMMPSIRASDFVLCRRDGEYLDSRHPVSVEAGSIYDDLARRDFTMNAIAIEVATGAWIDPHGGESDIARRLIRCVGGAQRSFGDDALRILRALRFSVTLNFILSDEIEEALQSRQIVERLYAISADRVRQEVGKMFAFGTVQSVRLLARFPMVLNVIADSGVWLKATQEAK